MYPYAMIRSKAVVLPANNIDTDQIIPARFLKITDKQGLGEKLFHDWRYLENGDPRPDFVLNQAENAGAQILLAGDNFGCGSSREHAPWALMGFGFRAVISTSFADIFYNNALKNSLLPVKVSQAQHQHLMELVKNTPNALLTVDLDQQKLILPDGTAFDFPINPFSKKCILNNTDELGYLLGLDNQIAAYESAHLK